MKFDASTQSKVDKLLTEFRKENSSAPKESITDSDAAVKYIANHASADQSVIWMKRLLGTQNGVTSWLIKGSWVLVLAGIVVAGFVMYGTFLDEEFLKALKDEGTARGLITFLFSLTTISLILIVGIASFWVSLDEIEARAKVAKDIITILIGIMGTIIGFYFGSTAVSPQNNPDPAPAAASAPLTPEPPD